MEVSFQKGKTKQIKALNNKSSEEWPLFLPPGAGNEWESCHPLLPAQTWSSRWSYSGSGGKGKDVVVQWVGKASLCGHLKV